jgi:TPR repeat protein
MEHTTTAVQIKRSLAASSVIGAVLLFAHVQASGEPRSSDIVLELRPNVVRVTAQWKTGAVSDGFGFIVGERDGFLYVVTADHVVRGDEPDAIDRSPVVAFFNDQGKEYRSELLETKLRPDVGDLAILRVRPPPGLRWRREVVAVADAKRDTALWFIGLQRDWFASSKSGVVTGREPTGTIIAEGLNVKVGSSGGPLISESGIVGMVVVDTGAFVRATPISLIKSAIESWNYPWQLGPYPSAPQPGPTPMPAPQPGPAAVPDQECDRLANALATARGTAGAPASRGNNIDASTAIRACRDAIKAYPDTPRLAFRLGQAYEAGGQFTDAVLWYRKAADQRHPGGQNNLGVMHANGRGGLAKNEVEAVRLYRLAADQGGRAGQFNLGVMYQEGRGGLAKNDVEAVRLLRLSADQGYRFAQTRLGIMFEHGRRGVAKNEVEAVRLFRLAAEHDAPRAQAHLGQMYEDGRGGLPKDKNEALRLYRLAADQGDELAIENLWRLRQGPRFDRDGPARRR